MGFLANIHESAVAATFLNFKEYMERHDALDTFYFAYTGMDKGENEFYAIIKVGQRANPNDYLVLTSEDLIKLESSLTSFMEAKNNSGQSNNPFYARLEKEIDRALISMGGHHCSIEKERRKEAVKQVMASAAAQFG